ncbi:MAG: sigma-70 family RNA polymerase sigma factor [Clostridia bacterium]|nr:sigma-70 family RNA polymerase sigma factor [Clostridia bacterium]
MTVCTETERPEEQQEARKPEESGGALTFDQVYDRYAKDVWRVCVLYFGSRKADAEDASQETFLRYWRTERKPEGNDHTKAWLIVTAGNVCKDMLRKRERKNVPLDNLAEVGVRDPEPSRLMEALVQLPPKWKTAVYLHYYEGLPAAQIAKAMNVSESTVFVFLHKGRNRLKSMMETG